MRIDIKQVLEHVRIRPGASVDLKDHDTDWTDNGELKQLTRDQIKGEARAFLDDRSAELFKAQELLWASDTHSVLIILQAMDAAGKDGAIKHVMSGVNPTGCRVVSFKQPTADELDHSFLWRCWKPVPERGEIVIYNRSHYEDVLVVRVHPEYLDAARLPPPRPGKRGKSFWKDRFEDINAFERHLSRNGTLILKFFLNVSKKEQKKRFLDRLDDPAKRWKFSLGDVRERGFWKQYMQAYEEMLSATSTRHAPWHIIPADNKWVTRAMISGIITHSIRSLDLRFPSISKDQESQLAAARKQLMDE